MKKLNSIAELKAAVKEFKPVLDLRENHTDAIPDKRDILVCGGTGCTSSDSLQIIENLKEEIEKAGLSDHAMVHLTGCFGFCAMGPIVKVYPDNVFYVHVKPEDAAEIVQSHIAKKLNMAPVEVYGVVSFYKNFSTVPTVSFSSILFQFLYCISFRLFCR